MRALHALVKLEVWWRLIRGPDGLGLLNVPCLYPWVETRVDSQFAQREQG